MRKFRCNLFTNTDICRQIPFRKYLSKKEENTKVRTIQILVEDVDGLSSLPYIEMT